MPVPADPPGPAPIPVDPTVRLVVAGGVQVLAGGPEIDDDEICRLFNRGRR